MVKRKRDDRRDKKPKEYEERLLEIRRVTRVTTGGRRMSFRATVLLGNRKGKIGIGVAKGPDVGIAVRKATHEAYKYIVQVPMTESLSIPYPVYVKHKASRIKLIPAAPGTGLKAGSSLRSVLELAGYENILSKIVGSNNKLNVALTAIKALANYKHADAFVDTKKDTKKEDTSGEKKGKDAKPAGTKKGQTPQKKSDTKKDAKTTTKAKAPASKKTTKKKETPVQKQSEDTKQKKEKK